MIPSGGSSSRGILEELGDHATFAIDPLIYAELSVGFETIEGLEQALPHELFRREPLPYEAAFLAGKAFLGYRRAGGTRRSPLPDFCIGAHAAISGYSLVTRDANRYRQYLIAPDR